MNRADYSLMNSQSISLVDDTMLKTMGFVASFKGETPDPLSMSGFLKLENAMAKEINGLLASDVAQAQEEMYELISQAENMDQVKAGVDDFFSRMADLIIPIILAVALSRSRDMAELSKESQLRQVSLDFEELDQGEIDMVKAIAQVHMFFPEFYYRNLMPQSAVILIESAQAKISDAQEAKNKITQDMDKLVASSVTGYSKGFASALLNRSRGYGILRGFQEIGVGLFEYHNPLDEKTTDFCRSIAGVQIEVGSALASIEAMVQAESLDELKDLAPFIERREINDEIVYTLIRGNEEDFDFTPEQLTADFMVEHNILIPPFHYLCRTIMLMVRNFGVPILHGGQIIFSGTEGARAFGKAHRANRRSFKRFNL